MGLTGGNGRETSRLENSIGLGDHLSTISRLLCCSGSAKVGASRQGKSNLGVFSMTHLSAGRENLQVGEGRSRNPKRGWRWGRVGYQVLCGRQAG